MRTWNNDLHFNLKWWHLDLTAEDRLEPYLDAGLHGMTVVGCSDYETKSIKQWAADNQVYKLSRPNGFESDLETKFTNQVNNGSGLGLFTYVEREICIFDTKKKLKAFESFLDTLPKRNLETFVYGRSLSFVKKLCANNIHRIVPGKYDDDIIAVSVDNKTLFLQLNLISSEISA